MGYIHITQKEMDDFMSENLFKCINPNQTSQELIYIITWHDECYMLKVYSSIVPGHGARKLGKDAIRVVLFAKTNVGYKPIIKFPKVYRTTNWKSNLLIRIEEGMYRGCENITDYLCPRCKSPLFIRNGSYTCSGWIVTKCSYNKSIPIR